MSVGPHRCVTCGQVEGAVKLLICVAAANTFSCESCSGDIRHSLFHALHGAPQDLHALQGHYEVALKRAWQIGEWHFL